MPPGRSRCVRRLYLPPPIWMPQWPKYRNTVRLDSRIRRQIMPRDFRNLSRQVAIIGAAECDEIGVVPNKSSMQLLVEAGWNALDDAGVGKDEVDGLFSTVSTLQIGEYLGIKEPKFTDTTSVGGSSYLIQVGHAAAAIASGLCEMAVVFH